MYSSDHDLETTGKVARMLTAESPLVTSDEASAIRHKFRADIQGLRAFAVISVVLYHADHVLLAGGFVGVDVFFVISGFLISGILMNELDRGDYSLIAFYQRRMRRLFPALYAMLAVVLVAGLILLPPTALKELGETSLSTIFFASNFTFDRLSGYFAGDSQLKPLLHTWSLAVEEQFYVIFPPFLALLWRFCRNRARLVLGIVALGSVSISAWAVRNHPSAAFFLLPSRMFELLTGALIARSSLPVHCQQSHRDMVSMLGLCLLLVSIFVINDATPFPGLAAILPCCGTALVLLAGTGGNSLAGRIIGGSAIALFFGEISYSLYLWHWPCLVFGRYFYGSQLSRVQALVFVVTAIAAAVISWRFIERPILKSHVGRAAVLRYGFTAMALGSAAALLLTSSNGLPSRFSPKALEMFASANDYNRRRPECHNPETREIPYSKNCIYGASTAPDTVLWGDSQGAELVVALGERLAASGRSIMQITASSCPPALDYEPLYRPLCRSHNQTTFDNVSHDPRIHTVVLVAHFIANAKTDWPGLASGFERVVTGLRDSGRAVVIVDQIPVQEFDPPTALGIAVAHHRSVIDFGIESPTYKAQTQSIKRFISTLASRTGARVISPEKILCDERVCHAYSERLGVLYFNADHLGVKGARLLAEQFPNDLLAGGSLQIIPASSLSQVDQ